jgi:hypothetical protein
MPNHTGLSNAQKRAINILKSSAEPFLLDEAPLISHVDLIGSLVPSKRTYFSLARRGIVKISTDKRGRNPTVLLCEPAKKARVTDIRLAGSDHQVVSVHCKDTQSYRRKPCAECPWRKDATGIFPAEAFVHSAHTAHDMSQHEFACHASGTSKPATCAGYLLKGSSHNLTTRLKEIKGQSHGDVTDGGCELHESYAAMAIANGVEKNHPSLKDCRSND